MPLTSLRFLAFCIGLAISIPVALVILWRRAPRSSRWALPAVIVGVLVAQGAAVAAGVAAGAQRRGGLRVGLRHRTLRADHPARRTVGNLPDRDDLAATAVPRPSLRQDPFPRRDGARRRSGAHPLCRRTARLRRYRQPGDPQRPGGTLCRGVPRDQRVTACGDRVHRLPRIDTGLHLAQPGCQELGHGGAARRHRCPALERDRLVHRRLLRRGRCTCS